MLTRDEVNVVQWYLFHNGDIKSTQRKVLFEHRLNYTRKQIREIVKKYESLFLTLRIDELRSYKAKSILDNNEIIKTYLAKNLTLTIKSNGTNNQRIDSEG